MKKIILGLFLLLAGLAHGATYYVSTTGDDGNAGTIGSPWLTWQKGFNTIVAGDILYIRGGTYTGMYNTLYGVRVSNHDGTAGNTIKVYNYPGETPILNCASLSGAGERYGIYMAYCDYWEIKGLTIRNVREYSTGGSYPYPSKGWELSDGCDYITIERCTIHHCANGFTFGGSSAFTEIYYINCDGHHNYDYWDSGGYAQAFNANIPAGSTVYYEGCRAWSNSDDGWDFMAGGGYITLTNCWAWRNGYDCPVSGNGDGFKLGFSDKGDESGVQRTVINCLSFDNKMMGFDESMDIATSQDMALYHCVAYRNVNDYGFRFSQSLGTGVTTLKNNISYLSRSGDDYEGRARNTSEYNTWDAGAPTITNADFLSVDTTGVSGARGAGGELPVLNFLKLASSSDMIGAGVAVTGLDYDLAGEAWDTPPSMGAYEYVTPGGGDETTPTVTTNAVTGVSTSSAVCGGNVTDDGGAAVTAKGVCWSESANPTTADDKTTDGVGEGTFSSTVEPLSPNTTYHVRAYATNSEGTTYGVDRQFTTPSYRIVIY